MLVLTGLSCHSAWAQEIAPGISPSHITVDDPLPAGELTPLHSLAVRNLGDSRLSYRMAALPAEGYTGPAMEWVRFTPSEFELEPGTSTEVALAVDVPEGAALVRHELLLQAVVVPRDDGGRLALAVSVAVAAGLEFGVGAPVAKAGVGIQPWIVVVGVSLLAGVVGNRLAALADRFEFSSPIRRKRPNPPSGGDAEGEAGEPPPR